MDRPENLLKERFKLFAHLVSSSKERNLISKKEFYKIKILYALRVEGQEFHQETKMLALNSFCEASGTIDHEMR